MVDNKKFTLFGKQPNDIRIGGGFLIVVGTLNIIFSSFRIANLGAQISFLAGILLLLLGIAAYRKNVPCIYIGTSIWLIGFIFFILAYFESMGTEHQISPVGIVFQAWVLWELVKSTPKYKRFMERSKNG